MASTGEYCASHNRHFGIRCPDCLREAQERQAREQLRLVSYEEWQANYGATHLGPAGVCGVVSNDHSDSIVMDANG